MGQQLREAVPFAEVPRLLVFDHDAKYGLEVPATVRATGTVPLRTSIRCPWQNGVAERGWEVAAENSSTRDCLQRGPLEATSLPIRGL